jgi:hypothetical protein
MRSTARTPSCASICVRRAWGTSWRSRRTTSSSPGSAPVWPSNWRFACRNCPGGRLSAGRGSKKHPVAVQRSSVRDSTGPSDARGHGDGREADLLEDRGGPGVPGVGEHEAGTGVQGKEGGCLVGRRCGGHEPTTSTSANDTPQDNRAYPGPQSERPRPRPAPMRLQHPSLPRRTTSSHRPARR